MKNQKRGLLARVGHYYYIDNMSQAEIAKRLNIHRSTVSRMLQQARGEGIVQIKINFSSSTIFDLENYFRTKYGLKDVLIVGSEKALPSMKEKMFFEEAAYYLYRIIDRQKIIGITWGSTLGNTIANINWQKQTQATFVPLVGGPSQIKSAYHVNSIVHSLSEKFIGKSIFINSTAVQETENLAQGIIQSKYFKKINDAWKNLDLAIVSVGGLIESTESQWRDLLNEDDYRHLREENAIGDCCCRFFDEEGQEIKGSLNKRTVGITTEQLNQVPEAVIIAYGLSKVKAIHTIIEKKKGINLVTDFETAIEILKLDNDKNVHEFIE
ncbi:hypothetical protein B8A40_07670 [Dolosigranulum pigrum]|uniref:sugar-binding transcriptional regulator n=1 Tax=Dolosigranulum pigrum TaxID=29394 RepID=UPI000DC5AB53|nr:sugar-binding domain-containing protein [Dolosigranulum pigrum]RAN57702.1 hypothetical protein B8A40_07670 [Dolosigranulum pigrum]